MRAAAFLALAASAAAHFQMLSPQSYFDDDSEPNAPCGGYNLNTTVDYHIGGDSIVLKTGHPQVTYLVRVASNNAVTQNVTMLYNADVQQSGVGTMCLQNVMVPSSYAGTKGVLQIIGDSPDGILYQCASVNFVTGTAGTNSMCTNSSGVTAAFVQDSLLATAATNATAANATSAANSTGTTSSGAASTSKTSGAGRMVEAAQTLFTAALVGGVAFFAL